MFLWSFHGQDLHRLTSPLGSIHSVHQNGQGIYDLTSRPDRDHTLSERAGIGQGLIKHCWCYGLSGWSEGSGNLYGGSVLSLGTGDWSIVRGWPADPIWPPCPTVKLSTPRPMPNYSQTLQQSQGSKATTESRASKSSHADPASSLPASPVPFIAQFYVTACF